MIHPATGLQVARWTAAAAGTLVALAPVVDLLGVPARVLVVVPLLFAGTAVGLYLGTDRYSLAQFLAFVVSGIGVLLMTVASLFFASPGPKPVVATFVVGVPALVGLGVFTLSAAYVTWTAPTGLVPGWVPAALVGSMLLDPIAFFALDHSLGVTVSLTGLAWLATGLALRSDRARNGREPTVASGVD